MATKSSPRSRVGRVLAALLLLPCAAHFSALARGVGGGGAWRRDGAFEDSLHPRLLPVQQGTRSDFPRDRSLPCGTVRRAAS